VKVNSRSDDDADKKDPEADRYKRKAKK
jgi:hypothetical protein